MGVFSKRRKAVEVNRYEGPGAKSGANCAYFNVYEYQDGSARTIEFSRAGAHLAEYEGEPVFADGHVPTPLDPDRPPTTGIAAPIPPQPLTPGPPAR